MRTKAALALLLLCGFAGVGCSSPSPIERPTTKREAVSSFVASSYNCSWNAPGAYYDGSPAGSLQTSSDGQSIRIDDYGDWIPRTDATDTTVTFYSPNLWNVYGPSTVRLDTGLLTGADSGGESWDLPFAFDGHSDYWMYFVCRK